MNRLLGAKELAALLGISLRKLEQMIEHGELPAYAKIGRTRKWRDDHVQQWLESIFATDSKSATPLVQPSDVTK